MEQKASGEVSWNHSQVCSTQGGHPGQQTECSFFVLKADVKKRQVALVAVKKHHSCILLQQMKEVENSVRFSCVRNNSHIIAVSAHCFTCDSNTSCY